MNPSIKEMERRISMDFWIGQK